MLAQRETSCPECFGGWGVAGTDGGDEAGDGAGGESDEWCQEDGGGVDGGGPSACGAGGDDAEEAEAGAGNACNGADESSFDGDLASEMGAFGAECSAESDLATALDDVEQCRVRDGDGDSGKDQGDWLTDSRTSRARDLSSLRTCEYLARSSGACSRPAFSYAAYIDARVSSSRSPSRQRASTVAA